MILSIFWDVTIFLYHVILHNSKLDASEPPIN